MISFIVFAKFNQIKIDINQPLVIWWKSSRTVHFLHQSINHSTNPSSLPFSNAINRLLQASATEPLAFVFGRSQSWSFLHEPQFRLKNLSQFCYLTKTANLIMDFTNLDSLTDLLQSRLQIPLYAWWFLILRQSISEFCSFLGFSCLSLLTAQIEKTMQGITKSPKRLW